MTINPAGTSVFILSPDTTGSTANVDPIAVWDYCLHLASHYRDVDSLYKVFCNISLYFELERDEQGILYRRTVYVSHKQVLTNEI